MKTRTSKRVRTRQPESQPELPETIQTIFNKYNKRKTRTISTSSSSKRDDTPSSAETRQKDPAAYLYEDSVAPWPDEEGTPAKTSTPCHSLSSFEKFRRLDLDLSSISPDCKGSAQTKSENTSSISASSEGVKALQPNVLLNKRSATKRSANRAKTPQKRRLIDLTNNSTEKARNARKKRTNEKEKRSPAKLAKSMALTAAEQQVNTNQLKTWQLEISIVFFLVAQAFKRPTRS
eukprot:m.59442 g.59442  ORF g.59442 m.59442 type:complete len:234 (+) comp11247_c0_seq2:244-945(+)